MIHLLTTTEELTAYDRWVRSHPQGSLWQSLEWKNYQEALGRETRVYAALEGSQILASALVIIDRTSFDLSNWDIPRGPLTSDQKSVISDQLMETIVVDARRDKCLSLYLSPLQLLTADRWPLTTSTRHEQPEATRIIDLALSEEEILKQMHPKGRYNIGVAKKHGVRVVRSTDVAAFAELMRTTALRDGFRAASERPHRLFLEKLPGSFLLMAYESGIKKIKEMKVIKKNDSSSCESLTSFTSLESSNTPIAGLMGVIWNNGGVRP